MRPQYRYITQTSRRETAQRGPSNFISDFTPEYSKAGDLSLNLSTRRADAVDKRSVSGNFGDAQNALNSSAKIQTPGLK
jgi:hypothetical protein